MEKEEVLKLYGLKDKEIKVYIKLLPLGKVNLQEVAKRVDLPRTTVYNTLNYLLNKGLVSKIIRKRTTFYVAVDPQKMIDDLKEKKDILFSILPALQSLKNTIKESSTVEVYEGARGVLTIITDIFKIKQQTYFFGSHKLSKEILEHIPAHVGNLRIERKIPAKIIIEPTDEERFHKKSYQNLTEMRFLESMKDFPCMIFIYGDKVCLFTLKRDIIGLIVKNEQVAEAIKLFFDLLWVKAKPVNLKKEFPILKHS